MMKHNWEYKKLGDVCDYPNRRIAIKDLCVGEYVGVENLVKNKGGLVRSTEMPDADNSIEFHIGDVLIGNIRPYLRKIWLADFNGGASGDVIVVRVKKDFENKLLPSYLYKVLSSEKFFEYDNSNTKGAKMPRGDRKIIAKYVIPIPPLEEQSRIVAELDLLTGIVDKQNAQLKELDNLAQAIFYDMFGDPIENPKGWEVKKLGDVSTSVSYGTSSPSSTVGKYKYLRMNNITYEGFLDLTDLKYIDMDDAEFEKYSVREGDVLFNRTNSMDLIGKTTYIHNMEPMIIAGYIIRVRLVDSVLPVYVSKFMNMPAMKKKLKGMAKGAVNQANINSKELKSIDIPLPPLALQQSFAEKIQSIEKQKETIRASIADTKKLLDYTMDKYFG